MRVLFDFNALYKCHFREALDNWSNPETRALCMRYGLLHFLGNCINTATRSKTNRLICMGAASA